MDNLASSWWWMFLIAFFVLWIKLRSNRPARVRRGKQISLKGQKILTPTNSNTPLECLLVEGKIFGKDYQEQIAPQLPHTKNCNCRKIEVVQRSDEIFIKKRSTKYYDTDLGKLTQNQQKYYKCMLIINNKRASKEQKHEFMELAELVKVDLEFVNKVDTHLKNQKSE